MTTEQVEPELLGLSQPARQTAGEHWGAILVGVIVFAAIVGTAIAVVRYIRRRSRKTLLHRVADYLEDLGGHRDRVGKLLEELGH